MSPLTLLPWLRRRRADPADEPPAVPPGQRLYAIGDIHGEAALLDRLLALITADLADHPGVEATLVFLGDYVDRGSDSRAVIERLSQGPLPGIACRFLAGNHEEAMLSFIDDPARAADWLGFGGLETLASYGVRASLGISAANRLIRWRDELLDNLPRRHLDFLRRLETMAVIGGYAFVHAGIRPGRPLERQTAHDLKWIRQPFLNDRRRHEKFIVHGHTITDRPDCQDNRMGIDTGAYATGVLTALALAGTQHRHLQTSSNQ